MSDALSLVRAIDETACLDTLSEMVRHKTYSETGQVRLQSTDWRSEPTVEFNLLSDKRDLDRLTSCPLRSRARPSPRSRSPRARHAPVVDYNRRPAVRPPWSDRVATRKRSPS